MRKISVKARNRDVLKGLHHRKYGSSSRPKKTRPSGNSTNNAWLTTNQWIFSRVNSSELNLHINDRAEVILYLPEKLNFSNDYEKTALHFDAIRRLVSNPGYVRSALKLKSVNFDSVKFISTSASIVLTAELSRWDDISRGGLIPDLDNWHPPIIAQLIEVGFFNLFRNPNINIEKYANHNLSNLRLVPYIKGHFGDNYKRRELEDEIVKLVGDQINKWKILSSGLSEAITNVTHHAFPPNYKVGEEDKNWYMGGSYDTVSRDLRIVFFDQGIGIPKSLPASKVWEQILSFFAKLNIPFIDRRKDAVLLRAAVEYERTSTNKSDRGKGLQDFLDFINERNNGYLSILSQKGLFKYTMTNGKARSKIESFKNPIRGTLIIWKVRLENT